MADFLVLQRVVLPPYNVLVDRGYLQHAGTVYLGHIKLRSHIYMSLRTETPKILF